MTEIKSIPAYQIRRARQLILKTVEINNDFYMKDKFEEKISTAKKIYRLHERPIPEIRDGWLGAYEGNLLVGALHYTSFLGQFILSETMLVPGYHTEAENLFTLDRHSHLVESSVFIEEIGVLDEYKNQGIGTQLLSHFTLKMAEEGLRTIALAAHTQPSIRFFQKHGFTNFKECLPKEFFGDLQDLTMLRRYRGDWVYLGKRLSGSDI